jgi:hypothetical protein
MAEWLPADAGLCRRKNCLQILPSKYPPELCNVPLGLTRGTFKVPPGSGGTTCSGRRRMLSPAYLSRLDEVFRFGHSLANCKLKHECLECHIFLQDIVRLSYTEVRYPSLYALSNPTSALHRRVTTLQWFSRSHSSLVGLPSRTTTHRGRAECTYTR